MGTDPGNGWGLARGDQTGRVPKVKRVPSRPVGGGGSKPPDRGGCLTAIALGAASAASVVAAVWVLLDKAVS